MGYQINDNDNISAFTGIAGSHDVLKPEQEKNLIYQTQALKSARARGLLIKHNYKLVIDIAKRYRGQGLDFEELIQEGLCGLDKGIDKFKPEKGFKLSTYATWWIKQSIQRALDNTSRPIRIPIHILNEYRMVKKAYRAHIEVEEKAPSAEVLAELVKEIARVKGKKIKIDSAEDVEIIGRMFHAVESLDDPHTEDENLTLMDYIPAEGCCPEGSVEEDWNKQRLLHMISRLEPAERNLLVSLWGLDGKPRTKKRMAAYRRVDIDELNLELVRILYKLRDFGKREDFNIDWGTEDLPPNPESPEPEPAKKPKKPSSGAPNAEALNSPLVLAEPQIRFQDVQPEPSGPRPSGSKRIRRQESAPVSAQKPLSKRGNAATASGIQGKEDKHQLASACNREKQSSLLSKSKPKKQVPKISPSITPRK